MSKRVLDIISIFICAVILAVIIFLFFFESSNAATVDDCKTQGEAVTIIMQGRVLGVDKKTAIDLQDTEAGIAMVKAIYSLYIPESILNGTMQEQSEFVLGFKQGWDKGCESEIGKKYTNVELYVDEEGEAVWLQDTLDGHKLTPEGDLLLEVPYVDLGGDETYYNTETNEYEYYYE